jgi:hypothetical protein
MSGPMREFKLFDVQKYREIQATVQGIANKSASADQAISLIDQALLVTKTASFQKYNDPTRDDSQDALQEMRAILQVEGLLRWPHMECYDLISMIISFICCPHYQEPTSRNSDEIKVISDTFTDYSEAWRYTELFSKELYDMLNAPEYLIEQLPSDGDWIGIFNSQELVRMTELVSKDMPRLSLEFPEPPDGKDVDDKDYPGWIDYSVNRSRLIKFYTEFELLLKLANSQPHHTIHSEVLYG